MRRDPLSTALAAFLTTASLITACAKTETVDRLRVTLSLPAGWEDRLDMEVLAAVSSTPYLGTLRLTFDCKGDLITREASWESRSLSLDEANVDAGCSLLLEAVTAGRPILQEYLPALPVDSDGTAEIDLLLREADGFSEYGSLMHPRQTPSAFLLTDQLLLLGGSPDTKIIEALDLSGGMATAYACSLAYPRSGQTALLDASGERIFVFGGSEVVGDEVFEVINKINFSASLYSLGSIRNDYFPVIFGEKLILFNGYDLNENWLINSMVLNTSLEVPSTLEPIGMFSENTKAKYLKYDKYFALVGGMVGLNYSDEVNLFLLDSLTIREQKYISSGKTSISVADIGNGVFLITGGIGDSGYLSEVEEVDLVYGTVGSTINNLVMKRSGHSSTVLKDGKILIVGGLGSDDTLDSAEIYDHLTGNSRLLPWRLRYPRVGHTATLLPDGRVVISGGNMGTTTVEVFNPLIEN